MAYQNVGTPRFYVDELSWLRSIGLISSYETSALDPNFDPVSLFGLNPSNQLTFIPNGSAEQIQIRADITDTLNLDWANINFWGVLGHNFADLPNLSFAPRYTTESDAYDHFNYDGEIVNAKRGSNFSNHITPDCNGFSLVKADGLVNYNSSPMSEFFFQAINHENSYIF